MPGSWISLTLGSLKFLSGVGETQGSGSLLALLLLHRKQLPLLAP